MKTLLYTNIKEFNPIHTLMFYFMKTPFILSSCIYLGLPCGLFYLSFLTTISYAFFVSPYIFYPSNLPFFYIFLVTQSITDIKHLNYFQINDILQICYPHE
jgi:hypothetical protein